MKGSRVTSWRNPGFAQGDDDPVVYVNWHDASAASSTRGIDCPTTAGLAF